MARAEEKKGVIKNIFQLLIAVSISYIAQAHEDTLYRSNNNLINSISKLKFKIDSRLNFVDKRYIAYKRTSDTSYCVAACGKEFNNTDLRNGNLCNSRLVCYGKSNSDARIGFVLYEEEQGGRVGKTCDIFEIDNFKFKNFVSIYVRPEIIKVEQLRQAIQIKKYTLVDSGHF